MLSAGSSYLMRNAQVSPLRLPELLSGPFLSTVFPSDPSTPRHPRRTGSMRGCSQCCYVWYAALGFVRVRRSAARIGHNTAFELLCRAGAVATVPGGGPAHRREWPNQFHRAHVRDAAGPAARRASVVEELSSSPPPSLLPSTPPRAAACCCCCLISPASAPSAEPTRPPWRPRWREWRLLATAAAPPSAAEV